jgi:hypothetical protein
MSYGDLKAYSDLQKTLISFFDELIDMFPKEGDFVALRILIKDRAPITEVATKFKDSLLPQRGKIQSRDKSFFDDNVLFSYVGEQQARNFKRLFLTLDSEDQAAIWKWMDAFVVLTEKCFAK